MGKPKKSQLDGLRDLHFLHGSKNELDDFMISMLFMVHPPGWTTAALADWIIQRQKNRNIAAAANEFRFLKKARLRPISPNGPCAALDPERYAAKAGAGSADDRHPSARRENSDHRGVHHDDLTVRDCQSCRDRHGHRDARPKSGTENNSR